MYSGPVFNRFEYDAHPCVQGIGDAAQHAQGVAFITGRLQSADLLLGRLEDTRQFFLGKSGLLAKGGDLQRNVPSLSGMFKAGGKGRVLQLLFEISVEICFFYRFILFSQSCMRSRAVSRSLAGMARPLLRMAMYRDDSAILHEKPEYTGIQPANMAQLKQSITERLGQRLPVILPVP